MPSSSSELWGQRVLSCPFWVAKGFRLGAGGGTHQSQSQSRRVCRPRPAQLERREGRVKLREEPGERGGARASRREKAGTADTRPASASRAEWPGAGRLLPRGGARRSGAGRTWLAQDAGVGFGAPPGAKYFDSLG